MYNGAAVAALAGDGHHAFRFTEQREWSQRRTHYTEPGGFLDTSNDERPGCSFRRFTSEHKEKVETEGFRTDVFTRINSQDGLIPNDIFILHLVI